MMTKDQILRKIEGLQQARNYADEVESIRLTVAIAKLWQMYDKASK